MRTIPALFAVSLVLQASEIGSDSVWKDGPKVIPEIVKSCDNAQSFPACFATQLAAKAPAPVVAFSKSMHNEAWMKAFRETGRMDVASVIYQFRANENEGWLFVNGSPALFDPDDFKRLDNASKNDSEWHRVQAQYPKAMLFPGDRSSGIGPMVLDHRDGTQEFIADYRVMDGCHACEVLGRAFFSFEFSPKGKFTVAHFLGFEKGNDDAWILRTRSGQGFGLKLGCGLPAQCEWSEEQRPADNILHSTSASSEGIEYQVTGAGNTQLTLKPSGSEKSIVVKVFSTPGLRR